MYMTATAMWRNGMGEIRANENRVNQLISAIRAKYNLKNAK